MSEGLNDLVGRLETAIRENPVPAALIGMGAIWLFAGGGRLSAAAALAPRVREAAQDAGEAASRAAGRVAQKARSARDAMSDALDGAGDSAIDGMRDAYESAREAGASAARRIADVATDYDGAKRLGRGVRRDLERRFDAEPLLLAAVGLAIGAGLGASLPATDFEERALGDAASTFRAQAADFVSSQKDALGAAAEAGLAAAKDAATEEGLTLDDAKATLADLGQRLNPVTGARSDG